VRRCKRDGLPKDRNPRAYNLAEAMLEIAASEELFNKGDQKDYMNRACQQKNAIPER